MDLIFRESDFSKARYLLNGVLIHNQYYCHVKSKMTDNDDSRHQIYSCFN